MHTQNSCETLRKKALENLVTFHQQSGWYQRLRKFVGADSFRKLLNEFAEPDSEKLIK